MANAGRRKLNFFQRMGLVEAGATKELQIQILNNRQRIEEEFAKLDPDNTGMLLKLYTVLFTICVVV